MASLFAPGVKAPPSDLDSLFDSLSKHDVFDEQQLNNQTDYMIQMKQVYNDTEKEDEIDEIIDSDQHNYDYEGVSTISMAVLFSVLAVLYIGFCAYYRKNQRSGSDSEEEWRQQRRRENQEVLDESISASTRVRNATEMAKLAELKMNIKKVLLLRLIVDGDYAEKVEEKKSSCEGEGDEESPPPSTPSSPSRLSFSSSKKYTDALNCSSRKITPNTGTDDNDTPTISLPEMVSMYGEECNICLNNFQVGDRVGAGSRCTHAFHEECISLWLLVRDGCPICRRSYFETESIAASTESTGDNVDLESGTARDGMEGNNS